MPIIHLLEDDVSILIDKGVQARKNQREQDVLPKSGIVGSGRDYFAMGTTTETAAGKGTVTATLKKTALNAAHIAKGAKMTPFSGWDMPLQFTKVLEEHMAVRKHAGLFDISHMGLVLVSAPDESAARTFLNSLVPQDLNNLIPGKAVYTQFLNEAGGILDDIIVYQLPQELAQKPQWKAFKQFLVITNAGNTEADIKWMKSHQQASVDISLVSSNYCLFALQGPAFESLLKAFDGYDASALPKRFHIAENRLGDISVLLSRTGYTGEDGVEIIVASADAEALWKALLQKGQALGCQAIGLAARDTLRLEAAYPLHGNDITPVTSPLEAGLGWSVKLGQESDFIGKAALLKQKAEGLPKRAYCLKIKKRAIARSHDRVFQAGKDIGEVTSGSISPMTNEAIAMAYLTHNPQQAFQVGDSVDIIIRNQPVEAIIVERPFYKPGYKPG